MPTVDVVDLNNQKVSEVEAFAILNRASQNTNRKLRALADDVVTSGDANGLPST